MGQTVADDMQTIDEWHGDLGTVPGTAGLFDSHEGSIRSWILIGALAHIYTEEDEACYNLLTRRILFTSKVKNN